MDTIEDVVENTLNALNNSLESIGKEVLTLRAENEKLRKAINRAITILPLTKVGYVIDELAEALKEK